MTPLDEHLTKDIEEVEEPIKFPQIGDFRIIKVTGNTSKEVIYYVERYAIYWFFWSRWIKIQEEYVGSNDYGKPKKFNTLRDAQIERGYRAKKYESYTTEIINDDE